MANSLSDIGIERLQETAAEIGRETGCRLIVLFGSVARRDLDPRDLDIAVLPAGGKRFDSVSFTNRLIQALAVQEIDVSDLSHAEPVLMMLVAQDGIPLFEATPGEFTRFVSLAARRFADTRKFRVAEHRYIQDYVTERGAAS
jgi:predicted nucleotidyltransferase